MNAKEKANELFNKYFSELRLPSDCEGCMQCVDRCGNMVAVAKKYALIALDEIINTLNDDIRDIDVRGNILLDLIDYWREVKQEIEKL